jgi:hypothetical protein
LCIQREKRLLITFPPVAGFITLSNRRMRLIREVSVLRRCFTDQTGDMVYTLSEIEWLFSFWLYAR